MASTDARPGTIYRIPVHQKRFHNRGSYISVPHIRSSSPHRTTYLSRRRHSTPPSTTVRFIDLKTQGANTVVKHFHPYTRSAHHVGGKGSISESIKSTPCPIGLIKRRYQDERTGYVPSTPTSLCSNHDLLIPLTGRSHNIIEERSIYIMPDIPPVNNEQHVRKPWQKREQTMSFDVGSDTCMSDEDDYENSLDDDINKRTSIKFLKWCRRICPCRASLCSFCQRLHGYPFLCLALSLLLITGLFFGLFMSIAFSSESDRTQDFVQQQDMNVTLNASHMTSFVNTI